jgi:hypothetical protein
MLYTLGFWALHGCIVRELVRPFVGACVKLVTLVTGVDVRLYGPVHEWGSTARCVNRKALPRPAFRPPSNPMAYSGKPRCSGAGAGRCARASARGARDCACPA